MKKIPTINETLDELFNSIQKNYNGNNITNNVILNFELEYEKLKYLYCLYASKKNLIIKNQLSNESDLHVKCNAIDWLNICAKRLSPFKAAITGKLKIKGNSKLISAVFESSSNKIKPWNKIKDDPADYEFINKRKWKKPKKVVAVLGAPGGKKGYTYLALNILLEGMKETGINVKTIVLDEYNIKDCTGCFKCALITNGKCIIKDDFHKLNPLLLSADLVIYAFPLYIDGIPGLLKIFLDRNIQNIHPYFVKGITHTRHPRRDPKEKYIVILSGAGLPEMKNFNAVIKHFDQMQDNRHNPVLAYLLIPQIVACFSNPLMYPLLLKKTESLKQAGKQIIENGKVDKKTLKIISKTINKKEINTWMYHANTHMQELIDKKAKEY